jgi:SAM-dependent methyltransferase
MKHGYFKKSDPKLDGLKWGNWGSRPYEYFWASTVIDIKDKKVIDLGTGLPSEHNWHEYVRDKLKPSFYVGIDYDNRMLEQKINESNHKLIWMDMSDLWFESETFDVAYAISTFEHIPSYEVFIKSIKETHRVLKQGSKLVVTLDEIWDVKLNPKNCICSTWNELEKVMLEKTKLDTEVSFGLIDFSRSIQEYFKPEGIEIFQIPIKKNADTGILHSTQYNSVVSYGIFEKI